MTDHEERRAQQLSEASLISDPSSREIAVGSLLEGFPGVLWRLIGWCDHREIEKFIISEMKVYGTPPETIMDVISTHIASAALQMAGHVQRNQMRRCGRSVMVKAAEILEADIAVLSAAKKDDSVLRHNLRLVPGSKPGA